MLRAIDPYININIETDVRMTPDKLNNNLYLNLKKKCEDKLLNKSYKEHGFVTKVYELEDNYEGYIRPEELHGVVTYSVNVKCRVCAPYKGAVIVCSIKKIVNTFIFAQNGPISVVIVRENIDASKFIVDTTTNIVRYKTKSGNSVILANDMRVMVTILSIIYNVDNIFCYAYLNKVADRQDGSLYEKNLSELDQNI